MFATMAASSLAMASLLQAVLVLFLAVSHGVDGAGGNGTIEKGSVKPERTGLGGGCSPDDIKVVQSQTVRLPNGIPTYTVHVINTCLPGLGSGGSDGRISGVHLRCGWFSSAVLVDPKVFRRLEYNDGLVNDGRPVPAGGVVSFRYDGIYPYPLTVVSSVSC